MHGDDDQNRPYRRFGAPVRGDRQANDVKVYEGAGHGIPITLTEDRLNEPDLLEFCWAGARRRVMIHYNDHWPS